MSPRGASPQFDRGFKSWCENVAIQHRKDIGLEEIDPIDPRVLAQKLGVHVLAIDQVPDIEEKTLNILTQDDPDSWSALTVCSDNSHLVVLNPTQSKARTNSDLAHELSHIIIGHTAARIDVTPDNLLILDSYDKKQEDEANWLAGCLLLPRPALIHIIRNIKNESKARNDYGVSAQMLTYRLNVTGARRQYIR